MRLRLTLIIVIFSIQTFAQSRSDSLQIINQSLQLIDLHFTESELDSMLDDVKQNTRIYQNMHKHYPANNLPYPFAFNPAPYGFKIPVDQQTINWNIPSNTVLPKNKND